MTISPHGDVAAAWRTLELGGGSDELALATVRLDLDVGYGPVRIALGPDGTERLLIPTQAGRRLPDSASGDAVAVKGVQLIVAGTARPFIEMTCTDASLQAPFRALVDDVLRRLGDGDAAEKAIAEAATQFRELLRQQREYSLRDLVGMCGELLLLNELLALNPAAAVCWTGPLPHRHDFSSVSCAAEVKSTLSRSTKLIHVSSLEQLDPPAAQPLYLVHTVLERSGAAGHTVRDLLEKAYQKAEVPAEIDRALEAHKVYDWRTNDRLSRERFTRFRTEVFRVKTGFPRLTRTSFAAGNLPAGVAITEYTIDLNLAAKCRVPDANVPLILRQLASVH